MKTSELIGLPLDGLVAKCMGHRVAENYGSYIRIYLPDLIQSGYTVAFCPSTDWAHGGPIIERGGIGIGKSGYGWIAALDAPDGKEFNGAGITPLIAAMRCYVASKLGDEVEIPEELK